jgi:hypothetical protein
MLVRRRALISKIYDHVNFALWVFLSVFVGYFFAFVLVAASRSRTSGDGMADGIGRRRKSLLYKMGPGRWDP